MESQQCLGDNPVDVITNEICFPSTQQILSDIQSVVMATGINVVYIASDSAPNLEEFQNELKQVLVTNITCNC